MKLNHWRAENVKMNVSGNMLFSFFTDTSNSIWHNVSADTVLSLIPNMGWKTIYFCMFACVCVWRQPNCDTFFNSMKYFEAQMLFKHRLFVWVNRFVLISANVMYVTWLNKECKYSNVYSTFSIVIVDSREKKIYVFIQCSFKSQSLDSKIGYIPEFKTIWNEMEINWICLTNKNFFFGKRISHLYQYIDPLQDPQWKTRFFSVRVRKTFMLQFPFSLLASVFFSGLFQNYNY